MPDPTTLKNKKARNYAGLAAFYALYCWTIPDAGLFPLNRRRWLAADVVYDTGNAVDFIDDAVGDAA